LLDADPVATVATRLHDVQAGLGLERVVDVDPDLAEVLEARRNEYPFLFSVSLLGGVVSSF